MPSWNGCGKATWVRLLDVVVLQKDVAGDVVLIEESDLPDDERKEMGATLAGLIGLVDGETGDDLGCTRTRSVVWPDGATR